MLTFPFLAYDNECTANSLCVGPLESTTRVCTKCTSNLLNESVRNYQLGDCTEGTLPIVCLMKNRNISCGV